jgi:hypothetical protein
MTTVAGEVTGYRQRPGRTGVASASGLGEPLTSGPLQILNFNKFPNSIQIAKFQK